MDKKAHNLSTKYCFKGGRLARKPGPQKENRFSGRVASTIFAFFDMAFVKILTVLIAKMKLWRYEMTYRAHLNVRKYHDTLVVKSPNYKKVSEYKHLPLIKRSTIAGFAASILVFVLMQYFTPFLNTNNALASSNSYGWPTNAAFSTATTNTNVDFTTTPGTVKISQPAWTYSGDGHDGVLNVASGTFDITTTTNPASSKVDGAIWTVSNTVAAGQNVITSSASVPTSYAVNDEVVIINLKGTSTDYTTVGLYEFAKISVKNATSMTVIPTSTSTLANTYNGTTQKIVVQKVPNYTNVTVASGATLTTKAFDGTSGGLLFFRSNNTITNGGTITASLTGYRGGSAAAPTGTFGTSVSKNGEWAGGGLLNSGGGLGAGISNNPGGGGGGGTYTSPGYAGGAGTVGTAGGGGANGGSTTSNAGVGGGGGYGTAGAGYRNAYPCPSSLDLGIGASGSGSSGGAGGTGVYNASCPGYANQSISGSGGGGGTIGTSSGLNQRAYLGSGAGGAGSYNQSYATFPSGSAGGGIIFIGASQLTTSGSITSQSAVQYVGSIQGQHGSGGSIILSPSVLNNTGTISAEAVSGFAPSAGRTYLKYGSKGASTNPVPASTLYTNSVAYTSPAVLGGPATTDRGLRFDAGSGVNAKANSLTWTTSTTLTGQNVKLKVRAFNSTSDTDMTKCYGPGTGVAGTGLDTGCADWSSVGKFFTTTVGSTGGVSVALDSAILAKQYIEVLVQLSSDGSNTPTLSNVTLSYDSLDAPTLPKSFKTNGTEITFANTNNYTSETSVSVKASTVAMGGIPTSGETLTPELELVTGGSPVFTTNKTTFPSGGVTFTPATHSYTGAASDISFGSLSGLTLGTTYNWKIRYTDQAGRVGPWSSTYSTFTPDQTSPTITSFATTSSDGNTAYASANTRILKFSGIFNDAGGSSGTLKVQYSQDGVNWGVYVGTGTTNSKTTDWTNYTTITASGVSQNIVDGVSGARTWYIEGTEGVATQLYARTMDMAGNVSGDWKQTSQADFDATGNVKNVTQSTATGEVKLSNATTTITLPIAAGVDDAMMGDSQLYTATENSIGDMSQSGLSVVTDLRWALNIPKNAVVSDARIIVVPSTPGTYSSISAQLMDSDNAPSFALPYYGAMDFSTTYSLKDYSADTVGVPIRSKNISGLVQTYVNRAGYNPGNYIGVRLQDGVLNIAAFEHATLAEPQLEITYLSNSLYQPTGDFISSVKDNLTANNYGNISWSADVPSQTGANALRFQIAANNDNSTWNYSGPGGSGSAYYASGDQLWSGLNGNRYIRYKAYLTTADTAYTSTVYDVSVGINTASPASNTMILDSVSPAGNVIINSGGQYATSQTATLYLNPSDAAPSSGISTFALSNDGNTWSSDIAWNENYRTGGGGYTWGLAAGNDGPRSVYVKYKDVAGNVGGIAAPGANWNAGQAETGYPTALLGKYIYNANVAGLLAWKNDNAACTDPYCSKTVSPAPDISYPSNMVLVDPIANSAVDFVGPDPVNPIYPAQQACRALGGRLPTMNELLAMYEGKVAGRYGTFSNNYYWSATEASTTNAYIVNFNVGGITNFNKANAFYYSRCIKGETYNISSTITLDISGPTIADSQAGDTTWRNANGTTYNVDFTDSGSGLANYQIKATTAAAQSGTVLQDWYSVDLSAQTSPYITDWSLPAPVWTALQEGTNYISIKAVDKAGQSTTLDDPFYIRKDTQGPTATVSYASGMQNSATISLSLTDSDTQSGINTRTLEYQESNLLGGNVDFGAPSWISATVGSSFTGTTGKAYKFRYSANDIANNNSAVSSPSNWIGVDTTAPVASISYNVGAQTSTNIALTKSGQDTQSGLNDYSIQYKDTTYVDNTADFTSAVWQEVGGSAGGDQAVNSYTGVSGHAYMFRYRVKNGANTWGSGNTEPGTINVYSEPAYWVALDAAAPTGTISVNQAHNVGPNYYVSTTALDLTLTAADTGGSNLATYELAEADGPWGVTTQNISGTTANITSETWTIPDVEATYTKYVRYADLAGNTTVYSVSVIYDKTPPSAAVLTSPADNLWQQSNNITFGFIQSLSADIDHYELITGTNTVAVADISSVSNTVNYTLPTQGMLAWKIVAVDKALNRTDSTTTRNIGWDQNIPSTTLDPGFTFAATENITDRVTLSWNNYADDSGNTSPAASYTIERIRTAYLVSGQQLTQNWASLAPEADYYTTTVAASTNTLDQMVGDIEAATPYTYRIKAIDGAGNVGNWMRSDAGMTYDNKVPSNPSAVTATVNGGFEVGLAWTASVDTGVGVTGYKIYRKDTADSIVAGDFTLVGYLDVPTPGSPITTVYTDNDTNNQMLYSDTILGVSTNIKSSISPRLNDYTTYYYRVTAIDANGNESPVISQSSDVVPVNTSENEASAQTPDVTAPQPVTAVYANAVGLDNVSDADPKQEIDLSWTTAQDLRASGRTPVGNGRGIKKYVLYRATEGSSTLSSNPAGLTYLPIVSDLAADKVSYPNVTLEDITYYYYKIVTYDLNDLTSVDSEIFYAKTGSSKLPSTATQVEAAAVKGDTSANNRIGKDIDISFVGAKYLDPTNVVTGYQVYRSTTNYAANSDWLTLGTPVKTYSNLNIPNNTLDPGENNCQLVTVNNGGVFVDVHKRCFTDTVPTDAVTYYYKIRTIGYKGSTSEVVYSSGLSGVITGTVGAGWDTVPDATAPTATADQMAIKVKDTYPKADKVRNILTWLVPATPMRGGVSDFARYEVWREIRDLGGVTTEVKLADIADINTNMYIDEADRIFEDFQFKYYILIYDNAGTDYKYADNTVINPGNSNKSAKIYSGDSITPTKAKAVITNVTLANVSVASATITWTTDQDTDSLVEYRPFGSTSEFTAVGHRERAAQHSVYIFGMQPNTRYEYRVVSKNYPFANETVIDSGLPELRTTGFDITPGAVVTTTSGATFEWKTNLDAKTALVEYKLNRQPGDDPQGKGVSVDPETIIASPRDHKVVMQGLKSNRTYTYKIKSTSTDNYNTETGFMTFNTKAFDSAQFTLAPASSNVAERNITATTAQIVWQTETPTTSWVDYSTTSGTYDGAAGNNDLTQTHVIVIEGLIPGTKYYYRVRVKDANEVEYTSQEYSFTAVLKPKISNMTVKNITPYSATISWDTNVETETIVNWGTTTAYGEKRGKSGMSKVHELVLDNLLDNQEYHYQILAKDETGNEVADTDKIIRTPLDTEGPKITGVKIDVLPMGENDTTSSVIVSWLTNKPATTLVEYDEGVIGGTYGKQSVQDNTLNSSHTVIIKDLAPATSYHYRLVSSDKRSNKTISQDYTFVTPTKEKSILQLILKSLEETFAWTRNLNQFFGNIGKRLTGN